MGRAPRRASAGGSDGGAWLDGDAAEAMTCDAAMAPFVTGEVNPAALEDLVRLCVDLDRLRRHRRHQRQAGDDRRWHRRRPGAPGPDTTRAWEALERAIIGKAVDLLSGPGGLASFLRRRQLGARLGGPSLPLDIGYSETSRPGSATPSPCGTSIASGPAGATSPPRRARFTTSSTRPTAARPAFEDCVLLCWFHHQVVIHRWGWTLVLNPDGTTTAWNPDKTKILHSHSPPPTPGNTPGYPGPRDSQWLDLFEPGHEHHSADQRRLRLPMLRDPARGSCPSTSRT